MKTLPLLRRINTLPRSWVTALALTVLGLGLYLSVVRPAELELTDLNRQVALLQAKKLMAGNAVKLGPSEQLAAFYEQFPVRDSTTDWLDKIHASALHHQLQLPRGEYRLADEASSALDRYQITLPIQGAYPDIRAFVKDVLVAVPAAALDNISFERQKIGDPSVQATVRLTLFLRKTS
jgi:Tfp pilus assembly protein PilO